VTRRIVLVGGGHAHVEVLRRHARRPMGAEVVLVSPHARQAYSGMMPAALRGAIDPAALEIDLPALCRMARARFVEEAATRVDADASGGAVTTTGAVLDGDLLSLDVGAVAAGLHETPGALVHAHAVRPLVRWERLVSRVEALLALPDASPFTCCVVGAGAGGVELALAVHARAAAAGRRASVALVDRGALLGDWATTSTSRVRRLLAARGIALRERARVTEVTRHAVLLDDGSRIPAALTVWTAGAAPHPLVRDSRLPADDAGWLRVDDTLRAADGSAVWGAGDCVTVDGASWVPKAGVYAVRAAPILAHNLRAAVDGGVAMRRFAPRRRVLALLDTADGRAIARWGGLVAHGRWAWWLKRAIDRRYVARYPARDPGRDASS
jgi:selenide, water dikinase